MSHDEPVTIRPARPSDAEALRRLAALDSARPPEGDVLVAEVGRELWAAVPLNGGSAIADPFRHSGVLVALLVTRAGQLRSPAAARRSSPSRRRRLLRAAGRLRPT